ncbi:MAG: hypothetical protein FWC47_11375 [Oscillospiraceae bacterium]|nr:hypothetical protein [Oscillospiraceae bacterium]
MKLKKINILLLTFILFLTMIGTVAFASVPNTYFSYQVSNSKGAPVLSEPATTAKKLGTLKKGTCVSITEVKEDKTKITWGKTVNGTYINIANLKSVSNTMTKGKFITNKNFVPLRYTPLETAKIQKYIENKGTVVTIIKSYFDDKGNKWGTTSDGFEVNFVNLQAYK